MTSINNTTREISQAIKQIHGLRRSISRTVGDMQPALEANAVANQVMQQLGLTPLDSQQVLKQALNDFKIPGDMTVAPRFQLMATRHMDIAKASLNKLEAGDIKDTSRTGLLRNQVVKHLDWADKSLDAAEYYSPIMREPIVPSYTQTSLTHRRQEQRNELRSLLQKVGQINVAV